LTRLTTNSRRRCGNGKLTKVGNHSIVAPSADSRSSPGVFYSEPGSGRQIYAPPLGGFKRIQSPNFLPLCFCFGNIRFD
jgi:hypothetical protein